MVCAMLLGYQGVDEASEKMETGTILQHGRSDNRDGRLRTLIELHGDGGGRDPNVPITSAAVFIARGSMRIVDIKSSLVATI